MSGPRSRRAFLQATTAAGVAATATAGAGAPRAAAASSFLPILRPPDRVFAHVESERLSLERIGSGEWVRGGVRVETASLPDRLAVRAGTDVPLRRLHLRWAVALPPGLRLLGDHWERGYGDLEWRGVVPERPMPWFFLAHDGRRTHGYGVRTGANALAHWQVDTAGVSLWLDVRCGGRGVELKGRTLEAATVVAREGHEGESAFAAARAFCAVLHDRPLLPAAPAYGGNSWYSAYDRIDADLVRAMTDDVVALSPAGENRPYAVIDSGWQVSIGIHAASGGPWREPNRLFPPMAKLSDEIRSRGARPGIWMRPLVTVDRVPDSWTLPVSRFKGDYPGVVLDPSVPEVLGPRARGRGSARPRVALRPREARLHDLRPLRPLGLRDGPERHRGRVVVRRPGPHLGRDRARPLRRHPRGRRNVRGHRLQHDRPPRGGPLRAAAHRRRHERPRVGAHAEDGRQHHGLPPPAARDVLRGRRRLRADHDGAAVEARRALAPPRGRERHAALPLARPRGPRPRAEGRGA